MELLRSLKYDTLGMEAEVAVAYALPFRSGRQWSFRPSPLNVPKSWIMTVAKRPYLQALLLGVFAALALIVSSLIGRVLFGIGTIPELASDRIAPLTGIPLFFELLNLSGGYSHLKQLGIVSTLLSEFAGGALIRVLYERLMRRNERRRANALIQGVVAAILILTVAGLWPNLVTNYNGLPPAKALFASVLMLLFETSVFLASLFWAAAILKERQQTDTQIDERRRVLTLSAVTTVAIAVSAGLLSYFYKISAYTYDGTENAGEDLPPITPNDKFYQVTKNNVDPRPRVAAWALEVGGNVSQPAVLHIQDFQAMPAVVQEVTLQCISNQVGGGLNSNAEWKGVPLREIIQRAGPSGGAKQVMFHGADGFVDDVSFEKAMHPQTLLVFEMNGHPLPQRHGFPVRLIVPGYVGEKSVKWLTKIEVRDEPGKGF